MQRIRASTAENQRLVKPRTDYEIRKWHEAERERREEERENQIK